jgi:hypothetical protein
MQYNVFLIFGAFLSAAAAALHIGIVVKGANRFSMARITAPVK